MVWTGNSLVRILQDIRGPVQTFSMRNKRLGLEFDLIVHTLTKPNTKVIDWKRKSKCKPKPQGT